MSVDATVNYADNGAIWYTQKIVEESSFDEAFAIGASGDINMINIDPYYVSIKNGKSNYKKLPSIIDFDDFKSKNIEEYYRVNVLGEKSKEQLKIEDLQKNSYSIT